MRRPNSRSGTGTTPGFLTDLIDTLTERSRDLIARRAPWMGLSKADADLTSLGEWADEQHKASEEEPLEQVRAAGREAEGIGTLGQSKPSTREMFEEVFASEDWRLREQRQQVGV